MATERESLPIIQNDADGRFEVHVEGEVAVLDFFRDGDRIIYPHTEVPPSLGGRGIAGQLTKHALEYARSNSLSVVPRCPYVRKYIDEHAEYQDLVAR